MSIFAAYDEGPKLRVKRGFVARGVLFEEPTMAAVQEREMERVGATVSLHGRRGAPVTELTPLER